MNLKASVKFDHISGVYTKEKNMRKTFFDKVERKF